MDFSRIVQRNYLAAKAKEFVESKYVIPVNEYDSDLKPFLNNLNESLFDWIANPNISSNQFKILLAEAYYTDPNIVHYIHSLMNKKDIRLTDIIQAVFDSNFETNRNTVRKIKILLNLIVKGYKPTLLSGNRIRYETKSLYDF